MILKQKRFTLAGENMSPDVYELLSEKARLKQITAYIEDLVKRDLAGKTVTNGDAILDKLDRIEKKMDAAFEGSYFKKKKSDESSLSEGQIVEASNIIGEIDKEDIQENDY